MPIQGLCSLLQDANLSDLQREQLRTVELTAGEMIALVDCTLDLARVEVGEAELQAVRVDLEGLMLETLQICAQRAAQKKLELTYSRNEDTPRFIQADPVRLKRLLVNLVNNAVKFTDRGYVSIFAQMASHNLQGGLQITVEDSGCGMSKKVQDCIFTRFQTTGTNPEEGTGLGLSICADIVHQMDGKIQVESVLGQGTRFQVNLPVRQTFEDQSKDRRKSLVGCRLLLISDSLLNRTNYRRVLMAAGATVTTCDSNTLSRMIGAEVDSLSYHALVVDVPKVRAVAQKLDDAENWRACRRVLLVDVAQAQQLKNDFASCCVISKPADYDRLVEAICEGPELPSSGPTDSAKPMKILIAEDSEVCQKFAEGLLSMQGHDVKVVSDGRSAVEAVKATDFDFVLMDIELPEMNGYLAAREIRIWEKSLGSRLPIVAMTAHRDFKQESLPSAADIDAWLTKPVDAETLAKLLTQLRTNPRISRQSKMFDQVRRPSTRVEVHAPRDATPRPSRPTAPRPLRNLRASQSK